MGFFFESVPNLILGLDYSVLVSSARFKNFGLDFRFGTEFTPCDKTTDVIKLQRFNHHVADSGMH